MDQTLLFAQTRVIIRPQLDESLSPRRSFSPTKALKRPRVALVLSGGGARSAAQIGVIRALEKHNIPIDFIVGTSLGAIIGGLYSSGYTASELENIALTTNWDDVLSLTGETKRTDLFVDQKAAEDRSFLVVRFQGFQPVIPAAVSSGQRLTNFLSNLTLQSLYHPYPSFDDLKIPFCAAATDLISGKRVLLEDGSLAEALRASATVPLLFNPLERDSMWLIDGGLLSNIPVDIAKDRGYDIVIAINSTSGLRSEKNLRMPWQVADQIMGIMMQLSNEQQLARADVVITPDIGNHLSSDFKGLDTLISRGAEATEERMGEIADLFQRKLGESLTESPREFKNPTVESTGKGIPDSLWQHIQREAQSGVLTNREINDHLRSIYSVGNFKDVFAEVIADSDGSRIVYTAKETPLLQSLEFVGCKAISPDTLVSKFLPLLRKPVNYRLGEKALADILRIYRSKGYSLARIDSTSFEQESGIMRVVINEGVIHRIDVQGGIRSQDYFVLREFPLEKGDVFEIDKANQGLTNINSTTLFEYVYLEVAYNSGEPVLTIRLRERPSQLLRLGLRADNERSLQGSIDIRDENFRGSGTELGLSAAGGGRNQEVVLEYRAHRLFNTYLTFNVSGFYTARNSFTYDDAPSTTPNHWDREQVGEYRDIHYGGRLVFGSQVERFGTVTAELILQNIRIKSLENAEDLEDRYRLSMVRFGSVVDSKDSYPFPQSGIGMNISYEFAFRGLGSERGYNAFRMMYESYSTWGTRHTFHPRLTLGFADQTMPLSQQFRLGGRETFFGLREDDRRGRQLLLLNMEYRYHLPVSILFDTYCSLRYDIGMISSIPEEVKFNTLRHGVGAELSLESPIGPAIFGVGKSFNLSRDLPENPIQQGPLLFYFMIGYQL